MAHMTAVVGEQLTWLRQSEALKITVLKTSNNGNRCEVRVEGWASTDVVDLNEYAFERGHNWRLHKGHLVAVEAN